MGDQYTYDVAIVGGGVAGSSLGAALARAGLGVVIVERERPFRDRVRGEGVMPWGVAELERLGLLEVVRDAGAVESPIWQIYADREAVDEVDLRELSPERHGSLQIFHPLLQEALLEHARSAGVDVLRPAKASNFRPGTPTTLRVELEDGREVELNARLVVGADGRTSSARGWVGAETVRDPAHHQIGGALLTSVDLDLLRVHQASYPEGGFALVFPQAAGRARAYIACTDDVARGLMGQAGRERFVLSVAYPLPPGSLADAELAGPVAFFPNADIWADRIAGDRVVLIGDAAGANDPTIGQGLALAFRDARVLRDLLLDSDNWERAIAEFGVRRRAYYEVLRTFAQWFGVLSVETGEIARRRRERVREARERDPESGLIAATPLRGPDNVTLDEDARRRYFGEQVSD